MTCIKSSFSASFSSDNRIAVFNSDDRTVCFSENLPIPYPDGALWFDYAEASGHLITIGL